jgi:hypothetical protein
MTAHAQARAQEQEPERAPARGTATAARPPRRARTTGIMTGLLTPMQYATVVYLTAPAARPVVLRAAASLPPGEQARVAVRDLPAAAFTPEPTR